jgi:hypothetical protein
MFALNDSKKVVVRLEWDGIRSKTDSGADFAFAETVVDFWSENQGAHASFPVVIAGLKQDRGFARVHRRVIKIQLGHGNWFLRTYKSLGSKGFSKTYTRKLNRNVK